MTGKQIAAGFGVLLLGCLIAYAAYMFRIANALAEESAQLALMTEANKFLHDYHQQHGEYPKSLELFAFTYPDGGDRSTLATLRYYSDGRMYLLSAEGAYKGGRLQTGSNAGGQIASH